MRNNKTIYDDIIYAKRSLCDSNAIDEEYLYFLKKLLHKNWRKGVAFATVIFSGCNNGKFFSLPRTSDCIKAYRKVEKMLRKGKPLYQAVNKDHQKVLASFTLKEVKFSKKKTYRIMSRVSYDRHGEDYDEYQDGVTLMPYLLVEKNDVLVMPGLPAFVGPRFFSHKKEAVKAAQKWVDEILPGAIEGVIDAQTEWSSKTAFKSVRYYCTETESVAVSQCVEALKIHKPYTDIAIRPSDEEPYYEDYVLDIIIIECIDDSRAIWR